MNSFSIILAPFTLENPKPGNEFVYDYQDYFQVVGKLTNGLVIINMADSCEIKYILEDNGVERHLVYKYEVEEICSIIDKYRDKKKLKAQALKTKAENRWCTGKD